MKNLIGKGENKNYQLVYTIHQSPKHLTENIQRVCYNDLSDCSDKPYDISKLLVIPTWQRSNIPIHNISEEVTIEMNRLYKNYNLKEVSQAHQKIENSKTSYGAVIVNP